MLFNSVAFAIFLPIVFLLYWYVFRKNLRLQNLFLLVVSYFFYGWWDWRFLVLIFISSVTDFMVGLRMAAANQQRRKLLLVISLLVNLGFLGVFKYYNFFMDSMVQLLTGIGVGANPRSLNVILPVGISFYTFQTLSYTIDIYRGKLKPTDQIIDFFAFVSFFPQLVAGPIERAANLLPQFHKTREFKYAKAVDGARQILWGMFKKVVIADTLAGYVDAIFSGYQDHSGSTLLIGAILFAFQIYGDFSGYSDIAIGTAKLFGFDLMKNFATPYFSRDIAEFWRRWHISLSTWFRDYVYIPLGGSYGSKLQRIRNIIITFTVSGLWHGANWTFVVWGFLNGLYYIPLMLFDKTGSHKDLVAQDRQLPTWKELLQMGTTFILTTLTWVFFRAETIEEAFDYLRLMTANNLFKIPQTEYLLPGVMIIILVLIEWSQRDKDHPLQVEGQRLFRPQVVRWAVYLGLAMLVLAFFGENKSFIYFQF